MSPRDSLALVVDERDVIGDETQNMGEMDADLAFQMRTSIRIVKVEKRVTTTEQELEKHRNAINRLTTMLALRGFVIPADIYALYPLDT